MKENSTISSKKVYECKIFDIYEDEIILPNGETAKRNILSHNGAAAILPIDENGNIILVKQYRHSVKDSCLEIPAGKLEKGEDPLECGIRELEEEIGYISEDFSFMFKTYIAVGYSSEVIHIYLAKGLKKTKQNLDEDEFLDVLTYTLEETLEMIQDGRILDSKTIASILFYNSLVK